MLRFLFWNLNKKPLGGRITRLLRTHAVDVLMLVECADSVADISNLIATATDGHLKFAPSEADKIFVFTASTVGQVEEQFVDPPGSITVRRLDLPQQTGLLLAVLHLPSRMNWSPGAQAMHSVELAREIRTVEADVGHQRTIVVGDLNQNPYDPGLVGAQGFNAVMTKQLVRLQERVVQGRGYPYFYNPMWSVLGDRSPGPPGTFFHAAAPPDSPIWNVYDQVLLRPSLMHTLEDVRILNSDGVVSLVNRGGRPIRSTGSDHLPLYFSLRI
jgi:hypothetical protein